jgi:hypothetical protein
MTEPSNFNRDLNKNLARLSVCTCAPPTDRPAYAYAETTAQRAASAQ